MKKSFPFIAFALLACGAFQAQSSAAVPARIALGGKAVVLVAGAAYMFPQARERVIAIGQADQGLGVFLRAVDPGYDAKAHPDKAAGAEVYAALKPDLCIFKSSMRASMEAPLKALGIPTTFLSLETPEDYYRELALLGVIFGDSARAKALVGYYEGVVSEVSALASKASAAEKPRVLLLQVSGDSWEVPPDSWMQTRLVELSGGVAVWKGANPGSGWARVGAEQVAAWNPDRIYVVSYKEPSDAVAAKLASDARLSGLKAARSGSILGVPQDFYSWDQPDARWGLGLYYFAKRNLPARCAHVSLEREARRFFKLAYGIEGEAFDSLVLTRMTGDWRR
jgi:iron complex transport system substrate-binding protein